MAMKKNPAFMRKNFVYNGLLLLIIFVFLVEGRVEVSRSSNTVDADPMPISSRRSRSIRMEEGEDPSNHMPRLLLRHNNVSHVRSLQHGGQFHGGIHEFVTQVGPVVIFLIFLFLVCCCWGCLRDVLCAICLCEICEGIFG
jgi:hypothetical protein